MHIIVVDDEEGVRRSLKKVLQKDGYEVILAERGEEAVSKVANDDLDIETVISDYKMPGMDGLETLYAIARLNPQITRIILTGYATLESAIEAVNSGIDGFLVKPFDNNELRAKVKECNIKKRLRQFVSEPVFHILQKETSPIRTKVCTVSIMFVDIRGFSQLATLMAAQDLPSFLDRYYFSPVDDIIHKYNGTLDKHIGDGVMAIFGAPVSTNEDAMNAVACAIEIQREVSRINAHLNQVGLAFETGIGIATGEVTAGIFGSKKKKEYTVLGTPVNLAAHLEKFAAKGQILICADTHEGVTGKIKTERVTLSPFKGSGTTMDVYRIIYSEDQK